MKKIILLPAILLISLLAYSQSEFQVRYSNHQNSQAKQIIKLAGKKTLLCSDFNNASGFGISLLCLDSNYSVLWYKEVVEQSIELTANSIKEAANGDILVAATATLSGNTTSMVQRWSSTGSLLWNKYYQGLGFTSETSDILELPSGEIFILGKERYAATVFFSFLLKVDENGMIILKNTYSNPIRYTNLTKILYDSSGYLVVYGTLSDGILDSYLISAHLDINGYSYNHNLISDIEFANTGNEFVVDGCRNKGSNTIVSTGYHTDSTNYKTVGLFRSDSVGEFSSVLGFRVDSNLLGYTKITATSDSGYAVTGILSSPYSVCLVKFDKNLNPQFARRFAIDRVNSNEINIAPLETDDHGFLIAIEDNIIIKTDSVGRTTCGNDTLMSVSTQNYNVNDLPVQIGFSGDTVGQFSFPLTSNAFTISGDSLCLPLAIQNNSLSEVVIYPLPAGQNLNVTTLNALFDRAVLIGVEGRTIPLYSSLTKVNEIKVNVNAVLPGLYVLVLSNDGKIILNKKVIISR